MDTCLEHQQLVMDVAVIKDNLVEVKKDTAEILKSIKGNGGPGLLTQSALNKASIKRAWWWLGGVSFGIIGIAAYIIKSHI